MRRRVVCAGASLHGSKITNAPCTRPRKRGLEFQREVEVPIVYEGELATKRRVDFVVWCDRQELILETKAPPRRGQKTSSNACST